MYRFIVIVLIVGLFACRPDQVIKSSTKVYKDQVATQFFQRTSGWIASDGALSVPLSDGRTLWLMGDSHIDDYDESTGTIPLLFQVRNAALLQPADDWDWTNTQTLIGSSTGIKSLFKKTVNDSVWLWPGNGIQIEDTVFIYCSELTRFGSGPLGFRGTGKEMWAKMKFPELEVVGYQYLPDFKGINFGAGFIAAEDDIHVYAFGQKLIPENVETDVFVGRFRAENPGAAWEYWDGLSWNTDIERSSSVAQGAISPHVTKIGDTFLVMSTELSVGCDQGRTIFLSTGQKATGPFNEMKSLYTIDDTVRGHYPFFYSVAAHPQFSDQNSSENLLVTYCINGYAPCFESENGRLNPDHYRPRAIRVSLSEILK
jgi:hypothetical protein